MPPPPENLDDFPELRAEAFLERFPEFRTAGAMLLPALEDAALFCEATAWGVHRENAIRLRTAHLLAISPYGRSQRMVADDGSTTYETEFKKLANAVLPKMMVV